MTIQVLIADDQDMIRAGIKMIINSQPDLNVVAEAADGQVAYNLILKHQPDVCLLDIRMPVWDGLKVATALSAHKPPTTTAVVMLTTFDLDEYVHRALRAGAKGFLLKDAGPELLLQAIRAAANGDALIAPNVTARLINRFAELTPESQGSSLDEPLTPREEQVLKLVAMGKTNGEIAEQLNISMSTIKTHMAHLMGKIGVRNRVEVAIWAYQTGLLPLQDTNL